MLFWLNSTWWMIRYGRATDRSLLQVWSEPFDPVEVDVGGMRVLSVRSHRGPVTIRPPDGRLRFLGRPVAASTSGTRGMTRSDIDVAEEVLRNGIDQLTPATTCGEH